MFDVAELTEEQRDRRRRVIDAAFELGAERGYDAVQMRDVAATANVALATIYRYFSSKDHLLAAAMTEWTARLQGRVAQSPPRGDTPAEQLVDVLHRPADAMQRQPKLSMALVRGAVVGRRRRAGERAARCNARSARWATRSWSTCRPTCAADILAVLGHVWYSTLVAWANGRNDFAFVTARARAGGAGAGRAALCASVQVRPASTSVSWGRPRMRSAMMLRSTSAVPPPTVSAGLNRNPAAHGSHAGSRSPTASMPSAPIMSLASLNTSLPCGSFSALRSDASGSGLLVHRRRDLPQLVVAQDLALDVGAGELLTHRRSSTPPRLAHEVDEVAHGRAVAPLQALA